ncbi:hypothetical protein C9374_007111 [Naegleria lovaniensis]|uniref:Vacuolar protein sorting-associated protein 8 central domain-containing protein n=1 Tax=Naegleria lovaniensis TaxID=51637 RepID=A0AA88KY06_NAELO|nr:uncharacterized protein C9374_007111 [Naegleria lovaniensis]KAG2393580.1 hypothetical protein C9374_007111 [Naegleria lovaniensis]
MSKQSGDDLSFLDEDDGYEDQQPVVRTTTSSSSGTTTPSNTSTTLRSSTATPIVGASTPTLIPEDDTKHIRRISKGNIKIRSGANSSTPKPTSNVLETSQSNNNNRLSIGTPSSSSAASSPPLSTISSGISSPSSSMNTPSLITTSSLQMMMQEPSSSRAMSSLSAQPFNTPIIPRSSSPPTSSTTVQVRSPSSPSSSSGGSSGFKVIKNVSSSKQGSQPPQQQQASLLTESQGKILSKKLISGLMKNIAGSSSSSSSGGSSNNVGGQNESPTASSSNMASSQQPPLAFLDSEDNDLTSSQMRKRVLKSSRDDEDDGDGKKVKHITLDKLQVLMQTLDRHDKVPLLDENINIRDLFDDPNSQIDEKKGLIFAKPPAFERNDQPIDIELFEDLTSYSTIQRRYVSQRDEALSHEFQLKPTNLASAVQEVRDFVKKEKERHQKMMEGSSEASASASSSKDPHDSTDTQQQQFSGSFVDLSSIAQDSNQKSQLQKQVEHESHMQRARKVFRQIEYRHVFKDLANKIVMEKIGLPSIIRVNSKYIAVGTTNGLIALYHRKTESRLAIMGSIQMEEIVNNNGSKVERPVQITTMDFGSKMNLPYEEYGAKSEQDLLLLYYKISSDQEDFTVNAATGTANMKDPSALDPNNGDHKGDGEENIEVLSQTSRVLVSGHSDGSINIWNLSTFKPVKPLKGYFKRPIHKIVNFHKTSKQHNSIEFLAVDTSGRMKVFNVRKIMFAYYVDVQPIHWANIPKEVPASPSSSQLLKTDDEGQVMVTETLTAEQQRSMLEYERKQQQEKTLARFSDIHLLPKSEGRHPLDRFVLVAVTTDSEVIIHSVKPNSRQLATLYNNSVLDASSGSSTSSGSFNARKKISPKIAWKGSQMVDGEHRGLSVSLNDQSHPYLAVAWGNRIAFYHVEVQQASGFFSMMFGSGTSNNNSGSSNSSSNFGNSGRNSSSDRGDVTSSQSGSSSDLPNVYFASEIFVPFPVEQIHWLTDDLFIVFDSKLGKMLLIDRKLESSTNWIEEVNCKDLMLDYVSDPMMNVPINLKKKYGIHYGGAFIRGAYDVSSFQYIDILRHSSINTQSLLRSIYTGGSLDDDTISLPSTTHSAASEMYRAYYGGTAVTVKHKSPTIYLLGASELRAMRCLSWDERVVALQSIGEYEEALNMSVEMFNDPSGIGALIGLPTKDETQRHEAVSTLISSILVDYRDTKLHQLELDSGLTHSKVEMLVQVARNCLQRAIEINNIELIEGTFLSFEHHGYDHIFLQLLVEELILNGALSRMMTIDSKKASYAFIKSQFMKIKDLYTSSADSETGEKGLIDLSRYIKYHGIDSDQSLKSETPTITHLSQKARLSKLENIILNLDISKLDIPFDTIRDLCSYKDHTMCRMNIYAHCILKKDFIGPVRTYLEEVSLSDLGSPESQEKADAILKYFYNIITNGTIFTDAYQITDFDILRKVKRLIIDFIFEQSRMSHSKILQGESGSSQRKGLRTEVALVNLEKLIKFNPKDTFEVLKLYFEELQVERGIDTSPFYVNFPKPIKCPLQDQDDDRDNILEDFVITSFADCVNEGSNAIKKWVPKLKKEELIEAMKNFVLDPPQGELDIELDGPIFSLKEKKYLYEFLGEMIARNILSEDKGQIKRIYTHLCHDTVLTSYETKELLKQFKEHEKATSDLKKSKEGTKVSFFGMESRQDSLEKLMKQSAFFEERKQYLVKEYDFKEHRQQIVIRILEKLESSNEQTISAILVRLIDFAQENNCYDVAVYLNRKKKDYKAVIKNFIDDLKLKKSIGHSKPQVPVFEYISELANDSEVVSIYIHDAILDHLLDLMRADSEEMTLLIVKYFPTIHPQVLNALITSSIKNVEDERLLFNYLSKIINIYEGNNSDILDSSSKVGESANAYYSNMSRAKIEVDMELQYQYIRLLCKFEPHRVCDWLQTHQFPGEKAEDILEYCRNIPDAVSFLLERNGEVMEALNIVLKNIVRETSILEDCLSQVAQILDPNNYRFSKYRHIRDVKERERIQGTDMTSKKFDELAEKDGKFFNVESVLGLIDLDDIPLDKYLEIRKNVLIKKGLIPPSILTPSDDKDGTSGQNTSDQQQQPATNPLYYGLDDEFIGRGPVALKVEDLPESKKIRKELAVAISMCRRNTQRKTVDEKQVKQLWFKLMDQFNVPFSEYYKSYRLSNVDSSSGNSKKDTDDENSSDSSRLQATQESDIDRIKQKIEQTKNLRKTKEQELLEKEKELKDQQDEEEKKDISKEIERMKKYISLQLKKEKDLQRQIQEIIERSKLEQEKSNQMHNLAKLWLQLIQLKFLRVVVLSAIGSMPIPEILKKLTRENAKADFSMYRQILLHLLDKYRYDLKLLQNAYNVVEEDTFTLSKKFSDRLMRGLCPTVPKCMLTDTVLTPEVDEDEDDEKQESKKGKKEKKFDVIRLFDTGYAYRLSALGNVTRCPTTTTSVRKKKFEYEKSKSITEVKKITNELSRLSSVETMVKKKPTVKLYKTVLKESQMVRAAKKTGTEIVFSGMEKPLLPPVYEETTLLIPTLFSTTTSRDVTTSGSMETSVDTSVILEDLRGISQEQIVDTLIENAIQF